MGANRTADGTAAAGAMSGGWRAEGYFASRCKGAPRAPAENSRTAAIAGSMPPAAVALLRRPERGLSKGRRRAIPRFPFPATAQGSLQQVTIARLELAPQRSGHPLATEGDEIGIQVAACGFEPDDLDSERIGPGAERGKRRRSRGIVVARDIESP